MARTHQPIYCAAAAAAAAAGSSSRYSWPHDVNGTGRSSFSLDEASGLLAVCGAEFVANRWRTP